MSSLKMQTKRLLFDPEHFVALLVGELARAKRRAYSVSVLALALQFAPEMTGLRRTKILELVEGHLCRGHSLRVFDHISRIAKDGTYLVLLPEASAVLMPSISERLQTEIAELVAGEAQLQVATRTFSYSVPSEALPDFKQIQNELDLLLRQVSAAPAL